MADDPYTDEDNNVLVVAPGNDAQGYLRRYEERSAKHAASYEDIMRRREDAIGRVRGDLDRAIEEMRAKQSGAGAGHINLPLLALGAGLLSPEPGGRIGNFGSELSRGLTAMGATIANQRSQDASFADRLAQLRMKSAELEDQPLRDRATFARQEMLANDNARARIEAALIRAQLGGGKGSGDPSLVKEWKIWAAPGTPNEGKPFEAYLEFKARTGADRNTPANLRELDAVNATRKEKGLPPLSLDEWVSSKARAGAQGKEEGKATGEASTALPGAEFNLDRMLEDIDRIEKHPGLPKSVGARSYLPSIRGGDAENFEKLMETLKGKAFLTQFEKLRGAGQITEIEGTKATDALMNLSLSQNEKQFRENLVLLRKYMQQSREYFQKKARGDFSGSDKPPMEGAKKLPDGSWGIEREGKWYRLEKNK